MWILQTYLTHMAEDRGKTQMHVKDVETPEAVEVKDLVQDNTITQRSLFQTSFMCQICVRCSQSGFSHCGFTASIVRLVHSTKQVYYH